MNTSRKTNSAIHNTVFKKKPYLSEDKKWDPHFQRYLKFVNREVGEVKDTLMLDVLFDQGIVKGKQNSAYHSFLDYKYLQDPAYARSVYQPEGLFEALERYDGKSTFNLNPTEKWIFHQALEDVSQEFSHLHGTLTPMFVEDVAKHLKLSRSAGAPFFVKKEIVFSEAVELSKEIGRGKLNPFPDVAYYRTQCSITEDKRPKRKVRLVWGRSTPVLLLEGKYAKPAVEALKTFRTPICLAKSRLELGVLASNMCWFKSVGTFDWSKFDSSIPAQLVSAAFDEVKRWFTHVYADFELVKRFMITSPIIMPDGNVWSGRRKGIASGSWFTNIIGSICNLILIRFLTRLQDVKVERIWVCGDDSLVGFNSLIDPRKMKEDAYRCFGMSLSEDKMVYSSRFRKEGISFLGHVWKKCRITRPIHETVQRLVYMERYDPDLRNNREDKVVSLYADNSDFYGLMQIIARELTFLKIPDSHSYSSFQDQFAAMLDMKDMSGLTNFENSSHKTKISTLLTATFN